MNRKYLRPPAPRAGSEIEWQDLFTRDVIVKSLNIFKAIYMYQASGRLGTEMARRRLFWRRAKDNPIIDIDGGQSDAHGGEIFIDDQNNNGRGRAGGSKNENWN